MAFRYKLAAVHFQRHLCIKINGFGCANALDRYHKLPRPRIQIVADAAQHRDEQQRENQESRFIVSPQVRDEAVSVFERCAAAGAEV
jgi:hypothetical protein